MRLLAVILAMSLTGCAALQEQRNELGNAKLQNNAANYQGCKRQICQLSYTETLRIFEGDNLEAWQAFCGGE